jgi:SAM-dependent methyltransferase
MAFGAVFHRNRPQWLRPLERAVYRVFGWPNIIRRLQWPHVLSMLQLGPNDTVVDLGAGSMQYTAELAKQAHGHVIAVDLLVPAGSAEWARSHNLTALNADALKLPFADHSIDRVVVSSLLQAVPDPDRMLSECHRVLKANGALVLIVPNHYRYIPRAYACFGRRLKRLLRLPDAFSQFVHELNRCFHANGPQGYFSRGELSALLSRNAFIIDRHRFSPGALGTLLWEVGILLYPRAGPAAVYLSFLFYPLAKAWDRMNVSVHGGEHVVKAVPVAC